MRRSCRPRSMLRLACLAGLLAGPWLAHPALAQTTPSSPAAAQPRIATSTPAAPEKPGSPVVESLVQSDRPPLDVHKPADHRRHRRVVHSRSAPRHWAHHRAAPAVDRPALAGIELLAPMPLPGEPPHVTVPTPAYPLDSFAAALTTPPPPIVCHKVRRIPDLPDPHLYRETTVRCEPDNP